MIFDYFKWSLEFSKKCFDFVLIELGKVRIGQRIELVERKQQGMPQSRWTDANPRILSTLHYNELHGNATE